MIVISKTLRILSGRGAGWKLGSDLLGRVLQYILLWSAARSLSQGDFGDFTFALSIGFMLAQVADFGLQLYVQRELARLHLAGATARPYFVDEEAAGRIVGGGLALKGGLSVAAMLLIGAVVAVEPVGNKGALVLVGLSMVLGTGLDYLSYIFRALGRLDYEAWASLVSRVVNLGLGVSLLVMGAGVWGLALAGNAAMLVALGISYRRLRLYIKPVWRPDWRYWRRSMGQPTAVGIGIIFSIISFRVDNLLIAPMVGREGLAVYNVAYKLFEPSLILPGVVLAATFPLLSQAAGVASLGVGRLRDVLGQTSGALALLGGGAGLAIAAAAGPIIGLLYGQEYAASVPVLQVLAAACLPMFVSYGLTHALIAVDKPRLYAAFTLVSLFVNVGANLALIPTLGVAGAAVATVVTEVALCLMCGTAIVRHLSGVRAGGSVDSIESAVERRVEGVL
jgi:O-antigen/teichoic acid export membrane protein